MTGKEPIRETNRTIAELVNQRFQSLEEILTNNANSSIIQLNNILAEISRVYNGSRFILEHPCNRNNTIKNLERLQSLETTFYTEFFERNVLDRLHDNTVNQFRKAIADIRMCLTVFVSTFTIRSTINAIYNNQRNFSEVSNIDKAFAATFRDTAALGQILLKLFSSEGISQGLGRRHFDSNSPFEPNDFIVSSVGNNSKTADKISAISSGFQIIIPNFTIDGTPYKVEIRTSNYGDVQKNDMGSFRINLYPHSNRPNLNRNDCLLSFRIDMRRDRPIRVSRDIAIRDTAKLNMDLEFLTLEEECIYYESSESVRSNWEQLRFGVKKNLNFESNPSPDYHYSFDNITGLNVIPQDSNSAVIARLSSIVADSFLTENQWNTRRNPRVRA